MSIENKMLKRITFVIKFVIICVGIQIISQTSLQTKEINIDALEVNMDKEKNLLSADGSVVIYDLDGNIINTEKAEYNKIKEELNTYISTTVLLKNGYTIKTKNIFYDIKNKIIYSKDKSDLTDLEGNIVYVEMFQYSLKDSLFSSTGKTKIIDINGNEYFFNEIFVDTKNKKMVGSDVKVELVHESFGVSKENEPRLVGNSVLITENKSKLTKGQFTLCKRRGGKCPPWLLQAKSIIHDKPKKTIYYEHATLKIYGVPIFYFPKFFHPDPTVERQSGFLLPFFTDTKAIGTGMALPYFWAIDKDKDLTFTPKIYTHDNFLILNEYRQAFKNGSMILDTSYTEGYQQTSKIKTPGSRNHIFGELDFNLSKDDSYESDFNLKLQKVSNDTYFRVHDINTALVDSETTDLRNELNYNYRKDNFFFNIAGNMFENLRDSSNARYEYIAPEINIGNSLISSGKFGSLDWASNTFYREYDVNKKTAFLINDFIWTSDNFINKGGIFTTFNGLLKNTNYDAESTSKYKNDNTNHEFSGVLSMKNSLPLEKNTNKTYSTLTPNLMFRFAPGHMRDLSNDSVGLKYTNLYALNKTSSLDIIEKGYSAILGLDYSFDIKNENNSRERKLSASLGQVFNLEDVSDMPAKSSLDQAASDIVGEINYNFSELSNLGYKFSLDHDLSTLNYNEISTSLNFGMVDFNIDYLEERKHVGKAHSINSEIALNFNESNSLVMGTKKNYQTDSTEFYNLSYQYLNDCLRASLEFRREFYSDQDVEASDSLMFRISILPLGGITTPSLDKW